MFKPIIAAGALAIGALLSTAGCTPTETCNATKPHSLDRVYSATAGPVGVNCSADHRAVNPSTGQVYDTGINHHWTV